MQLLALNSIIDQYDAFFIDIFGVIHDGISCYPESVACLEALQAHKKEVVLLSNTPRPCDSVIPRLSEIGVGRHLYKQVVTSGDATLDFLKTYPFGNERNKVFLFLNPRLDRLADQLDYQVVDSIEEADFMLAIGLSHNEAPREESLPVLEQAIKRQLPLVCANPDIEVLRISGEKIWCAGVIMEQYQAMGGEVYAFGKPYDPVYQMCRRYISPDARILCIGDNLHTDILGAFGQKLDNCLITGGILTQHTLSDQQLKQYFAQETITPTYHMPLFRF